VRGLSRLAPLTLAFALGCQASWPADEECRFDECDRAGSYEELVAAVEGHADPIAEYLRAAASEGGTLAGDYRDFLAGMGQVLGCAPEDQKSFMVLSNTFFIPKTIFAHCARDPQAASRFFLALPGVQESTSQRDVNPQHLHMTAWDEEAGIYRFYSARGTEEGDMGVNVSPGSCLGCHGGPHQLGTWQPLMNEITNPWSGWNAEPGFRSQLFDELLDPVIASGPVFRQVTAKPQFDSASNLEPIIRAGLDRFSGARTLRRHDPADVDVALTLLRPLYCDETVNFVSEVHQSGELRASAVIDPALAAHLRSLGAGDWPWLADSKIHVSASPSQWEALTLIPIRGESTAAAELGLVSRGVLTPLQAARVRALDWTRPVLSELRCSLYRAAEARIAAGSLDPALAALPGDATNADLVPLLYDQIMQLETGGGLIPLTPPSGFDLLAIPDALDADALDLLSAGDMAPFATTLADLGGDIDTHLGAINRTALHLIRQSRICRTAAQFPITPLYPDVDCP
jgi:hypothetical protein